MSDSLQKIRDEIRDATLIGVECETLRELIDRIDALLAEQEDDADMDGALLAMESEFLCENGERCIDARCDECPHTTPQPQVPDGYVVTYKIDVPPDYSAGLHGVSDTVRLIVESGDPGGELGDFADHIMSALVDWYDAGDGVYMLAVAQEGE